MRDVFAYLVHLIASAPAFLLAHAELLGGIGVSLCLIASVAWTVTRARQEVRREQYATLCTEEHVIWAGYDGEGVYAWSCTCGDGASDFTGLDAATIAGTEHLLDVGAVPELTRSLFPDAPPIRTYPDGTQIYGPYGGAA